MSDFSVSAVVVCDDVRKEVNGKDILVGVYGGGILIPTLPIQIPISIWAEIIPFKTGQVELDLKATFPGNPVDFKIRMVMEIGREGESVALFTPQVSVLLGGVGAIEIFVKSAAEENWTLVKSKAVVKGQAEPARMPDVNLGLPSRRPGTSLESSSPTAVPPPSEQSPSAAPASKPARAPRRPLSRRSGGTPVPE